MNEKEQKIFDMQCESTKALLIAQSLRPIEEDDLYFNKIRFTKIDQKAQCLKEDGTVDLNVRPLSQGEADSYNELRRLRGRFMHKEFAKVSSITVEKREKAQSAFMRTFSLATLKDKFKEIMGHVFKPSYAEIMAEGMKRSRE